MNRWSQTTVKLLAYTRHKSLSEVVRIARKRLYCRLRGYPHSIVVEPSARCNLACAMCWASEAREHIEKKFLSYQEFKGVVDDVASFCANVTFSFCGEPLLNPDVYDMIAYARQKGINVGLSTNGMLLNEDNVARLLDAGLNQVVVSLDAADQQTFETMRVGGDFHSVVNAVRIFAREKKKRRQKGTLINLQMIVTQKNAHQVDDFVGLARDLGADVASIKSLFVEQRARQDYVDKLIQDYLPEHDISRYKRRADGSIVLKKMGPCPGVNYPVIASNGDVYVCCFDIFGEYSQGNAISEKFSKVWRKASYRQVRATNMLPRRLPMCNYCSYVGVPEKVILLK
jgi:radical SAM protein with 4Fe4S-binding SPASM domain